MIFFNTFSISLLPLDANYHLVWGAEACDEIEADDYRYWIATYTGNEWISDNGRNLSNVIFIQNLSNQPERSKREDSQKCEMRCSEHCGNTVRDK